MNSIKKKHSASCAIDTLCPQHPILTHFITVTTKASTNLRWRSLVTMKLKLIETTTAKNCSARWR